MRHKFQSLPRIFETKSEAIFIAGFLIVALVFTLLVEARRYGDGQYYLAMAVALANHGWPALTPDSLLVVQERFNDPSFYMTLEGADGGTYAWHFFGYSLFAAPFVGLMNALGADVALSLPLANVFLTVMALSSVLIYSRIPRAARWLISGLFLASVVTPYLWWSGPEIFSASLVLVSAVNFTERQYAMAAVLSSLAALQNPSAIVLGVISGLIAFAQALASDSRTDWNLRRRIITLALLVAAGLLAVAPYLWSYLQFGTSNPITAAGYIDYSLIGVPRLFSLFFDLNQGIFVLAIGITVLLGVGLALRIYGAAQRKRAVLERNDLLLLAVLGMALPTLGQINWNGGQAVYIRYGAWLIPPLIVWAVLNVMRHSEKPLAYRSTGVAIAIQLLMIAVTGGPHIPSQPAYNQHKIWAKVVLSRSPELYNPDPEIFLMRTRETETYGEYPRIYWGPGKTINKALLLSSDKESAADILCGPGVELTPTRTSLRQWVDAGSDYVYLNGPLRCE